MIIERAKARGHQHVGVRSRMQQTAIGIVNGLEHSLFTPTITAVVTSNRFQVFFFFI